MPAGLEAVIRERHAAVRELRAAGKTLPEAAAALGLSRQLTGRFWRAPSADALLKVRGASALDPWKPYLRRRWDAGTTTIAVLHREITALGYAGSEPTTYAWLALLKLAAPPSRPPRPGNGRSPGGCSPTPPAWTAASRRSSPPSSAAAPNWRPWPGTSPHSPRSSPAAPATAPAGLDDWLAAAGASPGQPELASFANGIRRDYQAVRNALTLPWSSGPVEGLNTRTKLIKRQMYGRASFPLLRIL